jgi:hypothetical protein
MRNETNRTSTRAGRYGARAQGWLLGAAIAFAALFAGARADAQVTVSDPTVHRPTSDGGGPLLTRSPAAQYYISYADCMDDVVLDFPVSVPASTAGFQVWATSGGDCASQADRLPPVGSAGPSPDYCHELASAYPASGVVSITAQKLITTVFGITGCVDTTGQYFNAGHTAPQPLDIYFMLADTGTDPLPPGSYDEWVRTEIDLLGPAAPSPVSVSAADESLIVDLPASTTPGLGGYVLFCNPPANSDEGAVGTGGAGGGDETDAGSHSTGDVGIPFLDPQHPDLTDPRLQPFVCGSSPIAPSSRSATITGLRSGQSYAVAVAAYDEVDNVGPVSAIQCGTPDAAAPGDGSTSGGGCGISAAGAGGDLPWAALAVLSIAAVGAGMRRARSRRRV